MDKYEMDFYVDQNVQLTKYGMVNSVYVIMDMLDMAHYANYAQLDQSQQ